MDAQARKAAVLAYKERKTIAGVFAVICTATGQAWVGQSRHVDTQQNGLWFALRQGSCRHADLQSLWTRFGEESFRFEVLDRLSENVSDMLRGDELKKRAALWTRRLDATPL